MYVHVPNIYITAYENQETESAIVQIPMKFNTEIIKEYWLISCEIISQQWSMEKPPCIKEDGLNESQKTWGVCVKLGETEKLRSEELPAGLEACGAHMQGPRFSKWLVKIKDRKIV